MNDNKDNSLFTEMFGLPSEQPTEPQKIEPTTEPPTTLSTLNTVKEDIEEQTTPIVEEITLNSENDISNLNYQEEKEIIKPTEEPLIEMTSNNKEVEDVITLTPGIVEEKPTEEQTPEVENNILYSPEYIQQPEIEAPIVKKNKIVFNIIISILTGLSLCLGWYFVYTEFLSPDIEETELKEETEEKTPEEPEEPVIEEPKINFDENLSFYKGLTTNKLELYNMQPYTPQEPTGVVKCENISPINQDNIVYVLNEYYIYYENYLTKKVLLIQNSTYQNKEFYNASLNSYNALEQAWSGKKGLKYIIKKHPDKNAVENLILINLAYGSYFVTDRDSKVFYKFEFDYNDKIADVEQIIMNVDMNQGNIYCSTVITK